MTDDLDRLDQELREYGERWRATIPTAEVPPLDGYRTPPGARAAVAGPGCRRRGRCRPAERRSRDWSGHRRGPARRRKATPSAPSTSAAPDASDVVPWAPLDASRPELPRVTVPATPDPAVAAVAAPCTPADLRASSAVEGAAGTALLYLTIRPAAPEVSCRLEGHPEVRFLDRGEPVDIPTRNAPGRLVVRSRPGRRGRRRDARARLGVRAGAPTPSGTTGSRWRWDRGRSRWTATGTPRRATASPAAARTRSASAASSRRRSGRSGSPARSRRGG